jgi:hypothetical protein
MEYPPHNKKIKSAPTKGIAANKLVITIAPQKLICPQGKIYPKKAVIIIKINKITPEIQSNCLGCTKDP